MPLDHQTRHESALATLWLIAADTGHIGRAADMLAHLANRGACWNASYLLMPLGSGGFDTPTLGTLAAEVQGLDILPATHGTAPAPGLACVLPAQRLFVLEDGELRLRPRDTAHEVSPLDHLLPSLARHYGARLHVLVLSEGMELAGPGCAAVRSHGGEILSGADLQSRDGTPLHALPVKEPALREREPALESAPERTPRPIAHDLRQPLQTLTLLQTLLARQVTEPRSRQLVERLGETVEQLVAMLSQTGSLPANGAGYGHAPAENRLPIPVTGEEKYTLPVPSPMPSTAAPRQSGAAASSRQDSGAQPVVYLIDDDRSIRDAIRSVLEDEGLAVRDFDRCEAFLEAFDGESSGCLLVDAYLPGMSGIDLLEHLRREGIPLPAIVITGSSDVQMAVRAMKTGATDFVEKPVGADALISGVRQALALARDSEVESADRERAVHSLKSLTRRQRQIMAMVLDGHPSKNIAADLGISQRTVENHRAAIMKKTGSRSLPALARLALSLPQMEIE